MVAVLAVVVDLVGNDPAIVDRLVERSQAEITVLRTDIATKMGEELLDYVLDKIQRLKRFLTEPSTRQAIMAGMEATWWLNDHVQEWLGVKNVADTLTQSLPDNVTSQIGLALLDVADASVPTPRWWRSSPGRRRRTR